MSFPLSLMFDALNFNCYEVSQTDKPLMLSFYKLRLSAC